MNNNNLPFAAGKALPALLIALGTAVGSSQLQAANVIPVQVYFNGNCPVRAVPENIEMSKAAQDRVRWIAHDDTTRQPVSVSFEIFFDPFRGKSIISGNDGVATSQPVATDVPVDVTFKYTIYSEGCTPLDPNIRIR
jgi:hypothetical protein